jgi:hypothetical protein
MSPFTPKGSRALRVIITEMAAKADYGDVLTFADLAGAIDVQDDEAGRGQVRQTVSAARPLLLSDHGRALVAVRGTGYRVALPGEMAGVAQDHRRRADRSIGRALAVINHADMTAATDDERKRFQAVGVVIRNLHSRMTSAEQRLNDLEDAVFGQKPERKVIPGEVEDETSAQQSRAELSAP